MAILVGAMRVGWCSAALGATLVLGAGAAAAQTATPDERAALRAEHRRDLERLRLEHEKTLAEIRAETASLELKVALLRRLVPPQFEADAIESRLQVLARVGEMKGLAIQRVPGSEKVRLGDGGETPYERAFLDVSGQDSYLSLAFFLDGVGRLPLLVELPALSLEAAPDGTLRFAARLAFPYFTGWPDVTPPTPPTAPLVRVTTASVDEERAAFRDALFAHRAFLQRVAEAAREPVRRLQTEVAAIDEMKRTSAPARCYAALARLDAGGDNKTVALQRARFGPRTVIEGVAVGAYARAALRPAFEKAGFVVETLDVAPSGECRAFTLAGRLAAPENYEPAPDIEVGPSRFQPLAAMACSAAPQPAKQNVTARGTNGDITARLRDVDVVDVFNLLATVGHGSYVVDAAVTGRVNVDFERATLDEALAAMSAAGVTVGPGPLRRVSPAGTRQPPPQHAASHEDPISLSFKNGVLLDVVRLFQQITGLKAWTAPVADGRVTIFAREVPWDAALEGIAASAGMTAVLDFEGERLFVGPAAMAKAPWKSGAVEAARAKTTDDEAYWGKVTTLAQLGPEDLVPVGFARTADGVKGVAYGPGRLLWVLEPGVKLFEASVDSVDTSGVTFTAGDGRKTAVRFAP